MSFCIGSYGSRDHCVQYQESNLQFVQRLWEEEGISFHFEHVEQKMSSCWAMVHAFATLPHYAEITHRDTPHLYEESLTEWRAESALHSGVRCCATSSSSSRALNFRPKKRAIPFRNCRELLFLASTWSRALGISLPDSARRTAGAAIVLSGHKQCSRAVSGFTFQLDGHRRQEGIKSDRGSRSPS